MHKNISIFQNNEPALDNILTLLRKQTGIEFSYQNSSALKVIWNRLASIKVKNINEYLAFLNGNANELDHLCESIIPESKFFRDPKIFERLAAKLLPVLLENKNQQTPLRVWVAGCSTGQEAYSLLIGIHELLRGSVRDIKIQIFATDISEKAIAKARAGIYQKRDLEGVSEQRLKLFFTPTSQGFQINKAIRNSCVFALHNYLQDPPFSNIDFISCRNSLLFLDADMQKHALTIFHYGLRNRGYLMLGKSESADHATGLFTISDKSCRIYTKTHVKTRYTSPSIKPIKPLNIAVKKTAAEIAAISSDFEKEANEELLLRYTPPGVIIDANMDVVQFRGTTSKWLEVPSGIPSLNVLKMAREDLSVPLRNAILQSKATRQTYVKHVIPQKVNGKNVSVSIEVIPLKKTHDLHYLILFLEKEDFQHPENSSQKEISKDLDKATSSDNQQIIIDQLQREVSQAEANMRMSTHEHLAVNEELQTANEELLSGSEELQSMNEELESSREEARSVNEELMVLNQELYDRNDHLNILRLYAESIVATIREPLILLDNNFNVQNANPAFYLKFGEAGDKVISRNVFELGNRQWDIPSLKTSLEKILPSRTTITDFEVCLEFPHVGQRIMLLNATPVLRDDTDDQYILLVFEDVTEKRKIADQLKLFAGELETQVVERTESLRKANADLSYSNESLQQFAYVASHDLQEPLRKIKTFSNQLTGGYSEDMPEPAKMLISKIVSSTERMSALIREVLEFSRVLHGDITYLPVDLNKIIEECVRDFELMIKEKKAIIHWKDLPVIEGLPLQLSQLFSNLISNSLKFSNANVPPVITLESELFPPEQVALHKSLNQHLSYYKITIQDNGIGFDPEFSNQIFLIFHRLHARSQYPGTGIGLALCKKIVINHHGEIDVATEEGIGTSFRIILPIHQT